MVYIDSRTPASQKREAVPRRARIQGSQTFVSLNSRMIKETKDLEGVALRRENGAPAQLQTQHTQDSQDQILASAFK
jgi:hypothetical protein